MNGITKKNMTELPDNIAINFRNVQKEYNKSTTVFKNINMTISGSGIIALVGRNGSGKTTLFNMIMGYLRMTNGDIFIGNTRVSRMEDTLKYAALVDEKVRYLEEEKSLESIVKTHVLFNENFNVDRCFEIMDRFELDRKKRFRKLSKGMRNEFNIAIGLAERKDITLLDEPCSGLDEIARETFNEVLSEEFSITGKLYIVSTHMLSEIENIITGVIFLSGDGEYIFGDNEEILSRYIRLCGESNAVAELIKSRWYCNERHLGAFSSVVTENDFSFSEKTYIRKNEITKEYLKLHEIGRIVCREEKYRRRNIVDEKNIKTH